MSVQNKIRVLGGLMRSAHPVRGILARILVRTGGCRLLVFRVGALRFRFFPAGLLSQLFVDPHYYDHQLDFYRRAAGSGQVAVDVGANVGMMTLTLAQQVGSGGKVYAVEANPRVFGWLCRNIRQNRFAQVQPLAVAVGDHEGEIVVCDRDAESYVAAGVVVPPGGATVRLSTLDALLAGESQIDLLKVDVEGYELSVFRGAAATLQRTGVVIFELGNDPAHCGRYGVDCSRVLELLEQAGFSLFCFASDERQAIFPITSRFVVKGILDLIGVRDVAAFLRQTRYPVLPAPG